MRSGYYQTHYLDGLSPAQLDLPIHDLAELIFDNVYRQHYPAKFPHLLPKAKLGILLNNPQEFLNHQEATQGSVKRESHGAQHVSRVGALALMFLNMYIAYGDLATRHELQAIINTIPGIDNAQKSERFVKFITIAALFHDAGRYGDGEDTKEWEKAGGLECREFLKKLGCPDELAKRFGKAAAKKDSAFSGQKDILRSLVQCADCLDIQRVESFKDFGRNLVSRYAVAPRTRHFGINYLDIWRNATEGSRIPLEKRVALQKEILELSIAHRAWIASQHDLANASPIEVKIDNRLIVVSPGIPVNRKEKDKRRFEHGGFNNVTATLSSAPFLKKWYNQGAMLALNQDHLHVPENANTISVMNPQVANYLKPLQEAIDACAQVDQFCISLINLKHTLNAEISQQFKKQIQTNSLTAQMLEGSKWKDIPQRINELQAGMSGAANREERLRVVRTCRQELQPILKTTFCRVSAAVAFVLVAGVAAVIGATLGAVLGATVGSVGHIPGAGIGAFVGFALGAAKGWTIGCGLGMALGLGGLVSGTLFWHQKRAGIRESLHQVLDAAKKPARLALN